MCLGHQAICAAFGATVTYAKRLMHGKQSDARLDRGCPLFAGLPEVVPVARYHSLAADPDTLPDCLKVTARTDEGEIMAVQHRDHPTFGVQFHPESILTPDGRQMLSPLQDAMHREAREVWLLECIPAVASGAMTARECWEKVMSLSPFGE